MAKKDDAPMLLDGIPPKTARREPRDKDQDGLVSQGQLDRLRELEQFIPDHAITSRYKILTRSHANEVIGRYEALLIRRDKSAALDVGPDS